MAINKHFLSLFLLAVISSIITPSFSDSDSDSNSDLINELISLRSSSESGVIHLNDNLISKFLTSVSTPRPYSLIIFFDATHLHDKSDLRLKSLHREFSLVSSSFLANNNRSVTTKLFFCDIEFSHSQSSFQIFGVNALPHIRLITSSTSKLSDESNQMDQSYYSGLAESISKLIEQRTKLTIGTIHRPPLLSKPQITIIISLIVISTPFIIKRILTRPTLLHNPRIWLSGSIFIYFFSVAGTMHTIIRKMPMYIQDRNNQNKLVFFYQGSGMQLGSEGFAVGFLYTVVGLLLAFVTHVLVRVKNVTTQRLVMMLALFVSVWAVMKVVYLDNWKTGYWIHPYWPSSWR